MSTAPVPGLREPTNKQAVVIIHGVGEQVPMDTLRGFVDTVWTTDPSVCDPNHEEPFNQSAKAWSKPDEISGDFELRRITTNYNKNNVRTDFFEFYWAHLMRDTKLSAVIAWARVLLLRLPKHVPANLMPVWLLLWGLLILILAGAAFVTFSEDISNAGGWPRFVAVTVPLLLTLIWLGIATVLVRFAGDAARYLHVRPPNIDVRHAIRTAGVDLLKKLHESQRFDRIIIVGHSLGTVIGYDILSYYWQSCHNKLNLWQPRELENLELLARRVQDARNALLLARGKPERLAAEAASRGATRAYQASQAACFRELRDQGCPWLVTDFVTLGSPLAHAEVLMARNSSQLREKHAARELPVCPPMLEDGNVFSFVYRKTGAWCPHHAALFAPTRWTNIYFPSWGVIYGDPLGGPVAPMFGPCVKDVAVQTDRWHGIFSHTFYWDRPGNHRATDHVKALRDAVRIAG